MKHFHTESQLWCRHVNCIRNAIRNFTVHQCALAVRQHPKKRTLDSSQTCALISPGNRKWRLKLKWHDNVSGGFIGADWANCAVGHWSYRDQCSSSAELPYLGSHINNAQWPSHPPRRNIWPLLMLKGSHISYQFPQGLRHPDLANTVTLNDNQGAGKLAENPALHSRSKHIGVKY